MGWAEAGQTSPLVAKLGRRGQNGFVGGSWGKETGLDILGRLVLLVDFDCCQGWLSTKHTSCFVLTDSSSWAATVLVINGLGKIRMFFPVRRLFLIFVQSHRRPKYPTGTSRVRYGWACTS